jgi:hypothetical protein
MSKDVQNSLLGSEKVHRFVIMRIVNRSDGNFWVAIDVLAEDGGEPLAAIDLPLIRFR